MDFSQSLEILREGKSVRKHPMAPTHRLSFLKVGVAGHDDVDFLLGSGHGRFEEIYEIGLEESEFVTEPPAY